jgi:hypothetical protein
MAFFGAAVRFSVMSVFLLAAFVTSDCFAECMACWKLKGVIVSLKNGKKIEGYALWNDAWAAISYQEKGKLSKQKKFPKVIFDPLADIEYIAVYTHLRSVKYPPRE